MSLDTLNALSTDAASHQFMQCCTSEAWVARMVESRPYTDATALFTAADNNWQGLQELDYLQAFDGHPKIGDVSSLKAKYANTKELASNEQSSVSAASDAVIETLSQGNRDYEAKFGFIFIVCATGKSAAQMSDLLQARLPNDRGTELINAAEEQRKILQIRLEKLV